MSAMSGTNGVTESSTTIMTLKTRYTLADVTNYAREHFPSAFELICCFDKVRFGTQKYYANSGTAEGEMLYITCLGHPKYGRRIYARADTKNTYFYQGKRGRLSTFEGPWIRSRATEFVEPFCYVPEHNWMDIKSKKGRREPELQFIMRMEIVVQAIFLLNGRIECIKNLGPTDVLQKLKEACLHMEQTKLTWSLPLSPEEHSPSLQLDEAVDRMVNTDDGVGTIESPVSEGIATPTTSIDSHIDTCSLVDQSVIEHSGIPVNYPVSIRQFFHETVERFESELITKVCVERQALEEENSTLRKTLAESKAELELSRMVVKENNLLLEDAHKTVTEVQTKFRHVQEEASLYKGKYEKLRATMRLVIGDD